MHATDAPAATSESTRGKLRGRLVAVFVALVVVVLAVTGVQVATRDDFQAELQGWDIAHDGVLPVRIEIYRPAEMALTCSVLARDYRQVVVGQVDVDIAAGSDRHLVVPVEVPLEGDGVAPELQGCTEVG